MRIGKSDTCRNYVLAAAVSGVVLGIGSVSHAALSLVRDTWLDGTRTDPAAPVYSEMGVDSDADLDLESAWYQGGGGTFNPLGPGGPLRGTVTTSSSSWTTYFTPEGSEVVLNNPGDFVRCTWIFTPTNVAPRNTSQGFRVAVVDSPSGTRLTGDGSPGSGAYTGYAMFMNMGVTLGHSTSFPIMERNIASGDLLSTTGNWVLRANGIAGGNPGPTGYASGTEYTFVMTMTRTAAGELDIRTTMTGGNIGGTGSLSVSYLDPSPNSFVFDTFAVRPSSASTTAEIFDTRLFQVEFIPEPGALALMALGGLALVRRR